MKKKLWYLLALVCCLNFVACSDDDNGGNEPDPTPGPGENKDWTDYTGAFKSETLILNGSKNSDVEVTLAESGEKAKLTIKNLDFIIETTSLEIDGIEMKETTEGYGFEVAQMIGETVIEVTGVLYPGTRATETVATSLALTVKRKIVSDIVGEWHLNYNEDKTAGFNIGYTLTADADPAGDGTPGMIWMGIINQINTMVNIPGLIANKVEDVTVYFKEEGTLDFSWKPRGSKEVTLADALSGIAIPGVGEALQGLEFYYYTSGDQVFIGVDKGLLALLPMLSSFEPIAPYADFIDLAVSLFEIQGEYAVLALNAEEGTFELPVPAEIVNTVLPMLPSLLPAQVLPNLGDLMNALNMVMPVTESVNVSLNFSKK